ncbi:hypothetical protein [Empedobacter sp.]|uniref:hypothetical protein n=1 Tax=Empedobacter sp. TaxID=1927715 RepID=UPI0028A04704|nr:hypothetical protein [Empedobacter sp.]
MLKEMKMQVTAELAVNVLPNQEHEFLMTTKEVAHGYGTSKYAVYKALERHNNEMIEGKHFIKGVDILSTPFKDASIQPNSFLFTKRGIVRLGFFIKSKQAILFRDWAEEVVIQRLENNATVSQTVLALDVPKKTKHNRLTQERMISILADIAKIDDKEIRLRLISKLGV